MVTTLGSHGDEQGYSDVRAGAERPTSTPRSRENDTRNRCTIPRLFIRNLNRQIDDYRGQLDVDLGALNFGWFLLMTRGLAAASLPINQSASETQCATL
jgi:hypothetical protein